MKSTPCAQPHWFPPGSGPQGGPWLQEKLIAVGGAGGVHRWASQATGDPPPGDRRTGAAASRLGKFPPAKSDVACRLSMAPDLYSHTAAGAPINTRLSNTMDGLLRPMCVRLGVIRAFSGKVDSGIPQKMRPLKGAPIFRGFYEFLRSEPALVVSPTNKTRISCRV
jgi:hypothetical protein